MSPKTGDLDQLDVTGERRDKLAMQHFKRYIWMLVAISVALALYATWRSVSPSSSDTLGITHGNTSYVGIHKSDPVDSRVKRLLSIAVSGNHLVNGTGQAVTLHGVNISGTEWQCLYGRAFDSPHGEASIAAIAAWHVNAIRIPLNEDCWLGINGAPTDITIYHQIIGNYVEKLYRHGLYAILDLHWAAPGAILSHLGVGFAGHYEMADESHAPAFWSSVASYFKADHAVLFDLFNEPKNISWSCWLNGCVAPRGYQTAGMQQLVDVVREAGATQPVMVGGLEAATQLGKEWLQYRPTDPLNQIVASVHIYNQSSIDYFEKNIGVVAAQSPVVAGEIGEMNCADNSLEAFLPWADSHGVSYLAWAWFVGGCASYPSLISSYSGTPTAFGVGYRNHLLANFPAPVAPKCPTAARRGLRHRHCLAGL